MQQPTRDGQPPGGTASSRRSGARAAAPVLPSRRAERSRERGAWSQSCVGAYSIVIDKELMQQQLPPRPEELAHRVYWRPAPPRRSGCRCRAQRRRRSSTPLHNAQASKRSASQRLNRQRDYFDHLRYITPRACTTRGWHGHGPASLARRVPEHAPFHLAQPPRARTHTRARPLGGEGAHTRGHDVVDARPTYSADAAAGSSDANSLPQLICAHTRS